MPDLSKHVLFRRCSMFNTWDNPPSVLLMYKWPDCSAPLTKPLDVHGVLELKKRLRDRIALCHRVIVLSGMYVTHSRWIDDEIDTAVELGKSIIGVKPWGQERIPRKVQDNACVMDEWDHGAIVDAVRRFAE